MFTIIDRKHTQNEASEDDTDEDSLTNHYDNRRKEKHYKPEVLILMEASNNHPQTFLTSPWQKTSVFKVPASLKDSQMTAM